MRSHTSEETGIERMRRHFMKMGKGSGINKIFIGGAVVLVLTIASAWTSDFSAGQDVKAGTGEAFATTAATVTGELTAKRTKFVKQFSMSDGSFTAATYSMPVHYKKNGKWKEIDTTLVKSGNKAKYKTKSTALAIKVSKKAKKKSVITLKRGKNALSVALTGKNLKKSKAKVSNPVKTTAMDVLNQNTVTYKNVLKNTSVSYDIFPEKIQEIVTVSKKQKNKSLSFKINAGKLNVKVKGKKIYFKTKKGKTKYTRMSTKLTDANGVSTTNVKLSYNQKTGVLKVTPNKKWWNSSKRKYPMEIRTTYVTSKYTRDVKVGAAYAGAPDSNLSYDKTLLLQANKCVAFSRMTTLTALKQNNVQILDAALHIKNEETLKLGAGKTFDIGIHKVQQSWSVKKLTYNNRPSYESTASAVVGIQKKGAYSCDITDIVKAWYGGEANYGVALAADNSNRSYQAKLDRNPYFTVHYEIVGLDGAVALKEGQDITRDVLKAGQENYYYFDAEPGIAYDLYTTSSLDTQGILYDSNKTRLGYDDNSGLGNNFIFTQSYDGRRYLKVSTKGTAVGQYTLTLKKHFTIPEPVGTAGQDSYTIQWDAVAHAKEYVITVYDERGVIGTAVTDQTSYEYVYTNETMGKTLAFTVTPREKESLVGESSRKIYNTNNDSEWSYATPVNTARKNFSSAVCNEKIYVLGGITGGTAVKSMEVYDPAKEMWTELAEYPGDVSGVCNATMVALQNKLYVFGGQTDNGTSAKTIKEVWSYDLGSNKWTKLADMAEGRTGMLATVYDKKIYTFARAGSTERIDIYDPAQDRWTTEVKADTSINIQAQTIDGKIFVLREEQADEDLPAKMYWEEYLPETGEYDNAGEVCTFANADRYLSGTVVGGKIYMVNDHETNRVICYDVYLDTWSSLSVYNLKKEASRLESVGNTLYSLGGSLTGFGTLDVMESYLLEMAQVTKQMEVTTGESYELQVNAGNCDEDMDYLVTVRIDPSLLAFSQTSSFMKQEEIEAGQDGIQLMHYAPKKGVMILKLRSTMETGETYAAYQSIPVVGVQDGTAVVQMQIEKE